MAREAPELQLVNYYIREGYYHHIQVAPAAALPPISRWQQLKLAHVASRHADGMPRHAKKTGQRSSGPFLARFRCVHGGYVSTRAASSVPRGLQPTVSAVCSILQVARTAQTRQSCNSSSYSTTKTSPCLPLRRACSRTSAAGSSTRRRWRCWR